jgi:hypothetical protein
MIEYLSRVTIGNGTQSAVEAETAALAEIAFGRDTVTGTIGYTVDAGATWTWITSLAELTDVDLTGSGTGDVLYNSGSGWVDYPLGLGSKVTVSGSKIRFGNVTGGNYLEIDTTTGNLRLLGDATTFDDLRIDGLSTRAGVVAPTDETGFRGNNAFQVRNFVHNQADEVQFDIQLPHSWKEGGLLYPHVHFAPWISSTGAKAAQFILEYYFANVGEQFPASPSTYTMTKTWAVDQQWYHLIAGNATALTSTGKTLSSILKCRLYRDNTVSNNLAGKVAFLYFDIHYEVDGFGSDGEYEKDTQVALLLESGDTLLLEDGSRLMGE